MHLIGGGLSARRAFAGLSAATLLLIASESGAQEYLLNIRPDVPAVDVLVDGSVVARTDSTGSALIHDVAPGLHELGLRIGGVLCGSKRIEFDTDINLLPTQEFKCTVFVIESNVAGANLSVNGKPIHDSTGPDARATHVLPIGASSNIALKKAGFRDYSATISATQQGIVLLEARLDRLEAAVRLPKAIGAGVVMLLAGAATWALLRRRQSRSSTIYATPQQGLPRAFDQYSLEKFIGEGGIASIYSGVDVTNGEKVAVKILRGEWSSDPEIVLKFLAEGSALARIKEAAPEACVPRLSRSGREGNRPDGHPYLSMEFVAGETLARILERRKQLDLRETIWIAHGVATTLAHAHAVGIVHRDLSPENLLIRPADPELSSADSESLAGRQIVLVDFGIAAFVGPGDRQLDLSVTGKPAYMSPEQRSMLPPTPASDLFSLGVLLVQMLTGTLRADHASTRLALESTLAARAVAIPMDLEFLVLELLQEEPSHRPGSAREVARRLESLIEPALPNSGPLESDAAPWRM